MDNIKPLLRQIEKETNSLTNHILYLETENKLLQDSAYKDLELDRMKQERDEARRMLYQGFPIDDDEKRRIEEWQQEHKKKHDGLLQRMITYTYEFTPVGFGTHAEVVCDLCQDSFDFGEV